MAQPAFGGRLVGNARVSTDDHYHGPASMGPQLISRGKMQVQTDTLQCCSASLPGIAVPTCHLPPTVATLGGAIAAVHRSKLA